MSMESLRQVQAFQLVRETKGAEATPSGWRPGKKTLKAGAGPGGQRLERMENGDGLRLIAVSVQGC
jgi:alkyl hydroperoxide reductase subunit AhpC